MSKLKPGNYKTKSGGKYTLKDDKPLCESNGEVFYKMLDKDGKESILPLACLILEEDGGDSGSESYSTEYSNSSGDKNLGTDSVGGVAKPIKRKRGRPRKNKKEEVITLKRS